MHYFKNSTIKLDKSLQKQTEDQPVPKMYNIKTLKKVKVEHFQIKKLKKKLNKKKIEQENKHELEMTQRIGELIEKNELQKNQIKQLTEEQKSLELEKQKIENENKLNHLAKDGFSEFLNDCSALDCGIKEQQSMLENAEKEMQVVLKDKEEIENYGKYYKQLENKHIEIINEISFLKSKPKDDEIINAELKEAQINMQIQSLQNEIEKTKQNIEYKIHSKEQIAITYNQLLNDSPIEIENLNINIKETAIKQTECENEITQLHYKLLDIEEKITFMNALIKTQQKEKEQIEHNLLQSKEQNESTITSYQQNIKKTNDDECLLSKEQIIKLVTDMEYHTYMQFKLLPFGEIVNTNLISFYKYIKHCSLLHSLLPYVNINYFYQTLYIDIFYLTHINTSTTETIVNDIYTNYINHCKKGLHANMKDALANVNELYRSIELTNRKVLSDIKESLLDKINTEVKFVKDTLKKTVEICVDNKTEHQFISLFFDSKVCSLCNNDTLCINNELVSNDNYIQVISIIKHNSKEIVNIQFDNNFNYNKLSPKIFNQILYTIYIYITSLNRISFSNCTNINESVLEFLFEVIQKYTSLHELNFDNTQLSNKLFIKIQPKIKQMKSLTSINFTNNNLSSDSAFTLSELILANTSITKFIFAKNCISGDGLKQLLTSHLLSNRVIDVLDLSYNKLSHNDFLAISEYVKSNPNLNTINLSGNSIEMNSCVELGVALSKSTKIKTLNLSNINLIPEACPVLFQNFYVEELLLNDNPLGEVGCLMLSKALMTSKTVKKLSLKNIEVSDIGLVHLLGYICLNKSLKEIHLEMNRISDNGLNKAIVLSSGTECKIYFSQEYVVDKDNLHNYVDFGNVIFVG